MYKDLLVGIPISDKELDFINQNIRQRSCSPLTKHDIFAFKFCCCSNDVDRDYERFTVGCLEELSKLLIGKSGYIGDKYVGRIYDCRVVPDSTRKTLNGDDYFKLIAKAYVLYSQIDDELYAILKHCTPFSPNSDNVEINIGCAVRKTKCSICGEYIIRCPHNKGTEYNGEICIGELREPTEAYDWSISYIPQNDSFISKSQIERDDSEMADIKTQELYDEIAKRVKLLLTYNHRPQAWLAEQTGIKACTIGNICRGISPKLVNVIKIADVFGVSLDYILGKEPIGNPLEQDTEK